MTDNDLQTSRRSTLKLVSGTAVGAAGVGTATASDDDGQNQETTDGESSEWILRLQDSVVGGESTAPDDAKVAAEQSQQQLVSSLQSMSTVSVKQQFWITSAVLVESDEDAETARSRLNALSGVRDVHPNVEYEGPEPVERDDVVAEDHDEYTYGLEQINAPDVWEQFGTQGEGVSVAVLDTGIDPDHPDLELADDGWAFFDQDGNMVDAEPFDNDGHGTHVSGTVAGGSASGPHIGVAPEVDLYNAKVLNNGGTWAQIIAGIEWAVDKGVDVVNMSLGATGYYDNLIEPVQNATEMGTMIVSSAGNSGPETSGSPANVYESFSIGASNSNGGIAGFSSGELVRTEEAWTAWWLTQDWPINYYVPDVSAPGVSVYSAQPGGSYTNLSGTSMASPHTAGAAALLLSANPSLSIQEVKESFQMTAIHGEGPDATQDSRYGKGIIDVLSAVTAAADGNVVEGIVTDPDGKKAPGVTVTSSFGTEATTDQNGRFELYVADGDWELTVDEFGFAVATETVSASGGETVSKDIALDPAVDVAPLQGQPDVAGQGESFDIQVQVANLESLTVDLADSSDLGAGDVTLTLGETELTLGETLEFPSPISGPATITVALSDDATLGNLALAHEFDGPGEAVPVPTGPTEVMTDPADASFEIVDWADVGQIEVGGVLFSSVTVENTGDRTATKAVNWWLGDPDSPIPRVARLAGGAQTTVSLPIRILQTGDRLGTTTEHGWYTEDDSVSTTAQFVGAGFAVTGISAPRQVPYGETVEMTATLLNFGSLEGASQVQLVFNGNLLGTASASAPAGETTTVTFEFDTTQVVRGQYLYTFGTEYDSQSARIQIGSASGARPPAVVGDSQPQDLDNDGLYEDITGDGEVTVSDTQALFDNIDSEVVQNNPEAFNFSGDAAGEVTMGDVRAHYQELQEPED